MEIVRPRLDAHIHHRSSGPAIFSGEAVCGHLELLNGVYGRLHGFRLPTLSRVLHVVVINAVKDVVILAGTHPASAESAETGAGVRLHGACREQRQLDVVAPVQWQVHDLLVVDHLSLRRFSNYQQRRVGGHGNGFGHGTDF